MPTPIRTGYTFAGWYTEKENGKKVTANNKLLKNTTVYAHWTANTYTIKYDNNSNLHDQVTGEMDASKMTYDTNDQLQKCTFKNNDSGSHFIGWNTAADGSGESYIDEQSVKNLCSKLNGEITLYAQWTYDNIVKVRFEDEKGNMDNATITVIDERVSKGNRVSWSVKELDDYKNNQTQWEKQWITPDNYGAVNYTTENKSKITTIDVTRQIYYLDLNGSFYDSAGKYLGGTGNLNWTDGETKTATVKVEINDEVQDKYTQATDYFIQQRYGSTFKFTISMLPGYKFMGIAGSTDQPLSDVKVVDNVVTGIVKGERHAINENGSEYDVTSVSLRIQKEETDNSTEVATVKGQTLIDEEKLSCDINKENNTTTDLKEIKLSEINNDEEIVSD